MEQNVGGIKLNETVEKIIDFLVENKLIRPFGNDDEKAEIVKAVKEALEGAFENGNAPGALFNNPLQMKKMMLLIVSAAMEKQYKNDPTVAGIFNANELAKALFSPEMGNELAKKTIFNAAMALRPEGPRSRKDCEELAELIVQQKLTFGDRELHDAVADEELDNGLKSMLEAYVYKQKEIEEVQAFGSTQDGTPISERGPQRGNTMGRQDAENATPGKGGYLNIDNDPTSSQMSGEVRSTIQHKELDMGILDALCDEMEQTLKLTAAPRFTPPTTRT